MNVLVHRPALYLALKKIAKVLAISFGFFLLILVVTYFALPTILTTKIPVLIQQQTHRKASLSTAQLSLSPLQLNLKNFSIAETNGTAFVTFEQFALQINLLESLKQTTLILDQVLLIKPFVHISKQKNGSFNFSHLLKHHSNTKTDKEDSPLFPLKINKIIVSAGKLRYSDSHITQNISPIDLSINNFSTIANTRFDLGFSLALDALGRLNWLGTMSLNPLSSQGRIQLDDLSLEKLAHLIGTPPIKGMAQFAMEYELNYARNQLQFNGNALNVTLQQVDYKHQLQLQQLIYKTDIQLNYAEQAWQFEATKAAITAQNINVPLSANATLRLPELILTGTYSGRYQQQSLQFQLSQVNLDGKHIQLLENKAIKPLINNADVVVRGMAINSASHEISIDSIIASHATVQAWFNNNGSFNYQRLFNTTKTADDNEQTNNADRIPWIVQLNKFALKNCAVVFTDKTVDKAVSFNFKPISLNIDHISNQAGALMPLQLALAIDSNSVLTIDGTTSITPLSSQLTIVLKNFALKKLQAYLDKFANIELIDGRFTIDGKLFIAQAETGLAIKFNGNSAINEFLTRDTLLHKDLIKWDELSLSDINIDVQEQRYTAAALVLKKPYTKVTIRENKSLNLADIVNKTRSNNSHVVKTTPVIKKPLLSLGRIQLIDGASDFTDLSLIMPFYAQIRRLNGGANALSSEQTSTIKAALTGNAYDLAPVTIQADMNPHTDHYRINLSFEGMPMALMSPYMVQFAGYKVENGKLSLDLIYQIAEKKLSATNNILIDQFELGAKVDNPKAVSLPLELAVALLKDASGKIKLNVPITGSLDNPHFNIMAVIKDALINAMTKLVTSPFRLLANLVDSDADMSRITFSAGNAKLDTAQLNRLDTLAKALKARPNLHVTIKGVSFQAQDWPVIRHDALYDQLKIIRAAEIKQQEERDIRPEYVQISDADYQRLLTRLFSEKFPLLAETTLALKDSDDIKLVQQFYALAEQKLADMLSPEQQRLKDLAANRAQTIANYLVQQGGIDNARVFILDTQIETTINTELSSILALN